VLEQEAGLMAIRIRRWPITRWAAARALIDTDKGRRASVRRGLRISPAISEV